MHIPRRQRLISRIQEEIKKYYSKGIFKQQHQIKGRNRQELEKYTAALYKRLLYSGQRLKGPSQIGLGSTEKIPWTRCLVKKRVIPKVTKL